MKIELVNQNVRRDLQFHSLIMEASLCVSYLSCFIHSLQNQQPQVPLWRKTQTLPLNTHTQVGDKDEQAYRVKIVAKLTANAVENLL